jgi:hypothetical protein
MFLTLARFSRRLIRPLADAGETFYETCQVPRLFFYAAWRMFCRAMFAKW